MSLDFIDIFQQLSYQAQKQKFTGLYWKKRGSETSQKSTILSGKLKFELQVIK